MIIRWRVSQARGETQTASVIPLVSSAEFRPILRSRMILIRRLSQKSGNIEHAFGSNVPPRASDSWDVTLRGRRISFSGLSKLNSGDKRWAECLYES